MAFELVIPKQRATAVQRGEAALNGNGVLTFNKIDLVSVGFVAHANDKAAILVDKATRRIAIRIAGDKDPFVKLRYNKSNTSAMVGVVSALKELEVKIVKPRRYSIAIKEALLIVQL
jgi:hypothetical protein